jgi:hypothetical protein
MLNASQEIAKLNSLNVNQNDMQMLIVYALKFVISKDSIVVDNMLKLIKQHWYDIDSNTQRIVVNQIKLAIESKTTSKDINIINKWKTFVNQYSKGLVSK